MINVDQETNEFGFLIYRVNSERKKN